MEAPQPQDLRKILLQKALEKETQKFQECYAWIESAMPPSFFEEIGQENLLLATHGLMDFHLQDYFSTINLKGASIVMCLDSADADLRILRNYSRHGIRHYHAFVSNSPPPFFGVTENLRVVSISFTEVLETQETHPKEIIEMLRPRIKEQNPQLADDQFDTLIKNLDTRLLRALPPERLLHALTMFFKAQTRDSCQYEVTYDEHWAAQGNPAENVSMHIVLAWRNTPKNNFLYRLARIIHRHNLVMKGVNASYINPFGNNSILLMTLGLHGSNGQAAWEAADIPLFLREFVTVKYFASFDLIDHSLVSKGIVSGVMGNLLRAMMYFIHQNLVHIDPHLYSLEHIEQDLCRHPELIGKVCEAFKWKFDPDCVDLEKFEQVKKTLADDIEKLDTGQEDNDRRRRNVLKQALQMVTCTLKTNLYRRNYTALSFRLDPQYLDTIPFKRQEKFPALPYGVFYIKGMHFFGFHIRFKDLARGGLRTVFPEQTEKMITERNNVFTECYQLAYTQHLKNKDIPEGGAKGVIFLKPFERLDLESEIFREELEDQKTAPFDIENKILQFREEQRLQYLYQTQRAFIENLLPLVNCEPDGRLKAHYIVDYWKKPEYLYIGPDEHMSPTMIQWIADDSQKHHYRPGTSFISSKPNAGINHKEYGVTSLGVNVYMVEVLKSLGIDPEKDRFTVKMSGGPDGDVAGNQIANLWHYYSETAKLVALTDVSGTIHDPEGLHLDVLFRLFKEGKPIRFYPPQLLSKGGFLVDKETKRNPSAFMQQTLCWKNEGGNIQEDWLSGSEMNTLLRYNVHHTSADVFIPAGGRPRTLNDSNWKEFLDAKGQPTARAIVEGANLYLTQGAREALEKLGVLIIKDSSANKTGVICSSFEVLCGLTLGDEVFKQHKEELIKEILERARLCAWKEANLLLKTHQETGEMLSILSTQVSKRINDYTYQLLDSLDRSPLPTDPKHPLLACFFSYCLPTLRDHFKDQLMREIPDSHKKAIIACHIAAQVVYERGLSWIPTISDMLPLVLEGVFKV